MNVNGKRCWFLTVSMFIRLLYNRSIPSAISLPKRSHGPHYFILHTKFPVPEQVQLRGHPWFDWKSHHRHRWECRYVTFSVKRKYWWRVLYFQIGIGKETAKASPHQCRQVDNSDIVKTSRHCSHTTRKYTSPFAMKKRRNLPSPS